MPLALGSCLRPTEITLRLDTDVPCPTLGAQGGTAVIGGAPGDAPLATTSDCSGAAVPYTVGTLVVAPSGAKDETVRLAVVAGVTRRLDECAANQYDGCIVARRKLRFVPHTPLDLPVRLSLACVGVRCGDEQTCVEGKCVTADVDDPSFCTGGPTCGTPVVAEGGVDAGPADAGGDAGRDAAVVDADVSDGAAELLFAVGPAYGITADDTGLYWTVNDPLKDGGAIYRMLWNLIGTTSPPDTLQTYSTAVYGVASDNAGRAWVTGDFGTATPNGCANELSTQTKSGVDPGIYNCQARGILCGLAYAPTPQGLVASPLAVATAYVKGPGASAFSQASATTPNPSSYPQVRSISPATVVYLPQGTGLAAYDYPAGGALGASVDSGVGVAPAEIVGVGLGTTSTFVTATDGKVYALGAVGAKELASVKGARARALASDPAEPGPSLRRRRSGRQRHQKRESLNP